MTYRKSFLSVWNSIKKISSLLGEAADDHLKSNIVLPWLVNFIKKFLEVYKKNERNSWEYQISHIQFKNLNTDAEKKCYLIQQFNASLLLYSEDKDNPWIIDDDNKHFIKIKKKHDSKNINNKLARISLTNLYVRYSKATESTNIYLPSLSVWERVNRLADKSIVLQFLGIIWNTVSSHANLLKWISFFLIAFSLSLHFFPLIVMCIAGLALSYFIVQCIVSFKNYSSTTFSSLAAQEEEKLIQCIKQDVFNKETHKREFDLIQDQLANSTTDIAKVYEHLVSLQKTDINELLQKFELEDSSVFQTLIRVYPKTQFIASLVINITSVTLYGFLISWAASAFLSVIGAATLAGLVASPPVLCILISVPIIFFLIRHLIQSLSRESHYQKKIYSLLNSTCEYTFTDLKGQKHQIEIEKWRKFEYLQEEIHLLETNIRKILKEKVIATDSPLYLLFKDHSGNKSDIYKLNDQDKAQRKKIPLFTKIKKILNRFISFVMGGFYGYGLGQQLAVESSLGISVALKAALLPVIIIMLPLIVINAVANLITYHLDSRQRDLIFFAEHLDSKLQNLAYTRKKLHYLGASLEALETPSTNEKRAHNSEKQIKFPKNKSSTPPLQTKFFSRSTSQLTHENLPETDRSNSFTRLTP